MDLRRTMQMYAMLWNSAYAEIERDGAGRPFALWPIEPWRVTPYRRTPQSPLQYRVSNPSGSETFFDRRDLIHVRGLTADGVAPIDPIMKMRESISLALAAERFGGQFFGNGSTFGGIITYQGDPGEQVKKDTREALARRHQGVENAHKLLAL
jgi:HK97 family phage portal protein